MTEEQKKLLKEFQESQEEIILEDEEVERNANYDYINAKKLFIAKNVRNIPDYLFKKCYKLESIEIEKGNKYYKLADGFLYNANGEAVTCVGTPYIPDDWKETNFGVFERYANQSVENFYIGKSLKTIASVYRDFSIKNITLSDKNKHFELEDGCLYGKGGSEIILGCDNSVIGKRAMTIGHSAFRHCAMESVEIHSDRLKTIDKCAFIHCDKLKEIKLPQSVKNIEYAAFEHCESLKTIDLPKSLDKISDSSFAFSGLERIKIPNSVEKIEKLGFGYCKNLNEVSIGDSVKTIGKQAFCSCKAIESFTMPDCVVEIGGNVFNECVKLKEIKLSQSLKTIPQCCFNECAALQSITLPSSVTTIEDNAFYGCVSLESINLDNVTNIEEAAFKNCKVLIETGSLANAKKKAKNAFAGCKKLQETLPKPQAKPLRTDLFTCLTIEDITNDFKPNAILEFTAWTTDEVAVRLIKAGKVDGKNYVLVNYKSNKIVSEYCIEITGEASEDERFTSYDYPWYRCNVSNSESEIYAIVKNALK